MRSAGYLEFEQSEYKGSEEHLTIIENKVKKKKERLRELQKKATEAYGSAQEVQHQLDKIALVLEHTVEFLRKYIKELEESLPEVGASESAKAYQEKKMKPFIKHFSGLSRQTYICYVKVMNK